jgi:hypothetical protein
MLYGQHALAVPKARLEREAVVSWMMQGKGSKRRVRQVRWKRSEIIKLILIAVAITIFTVWLALWVASHDFD